VLPCVDWVKRHLRRASGTEHRLARSVRLMLPLAHFAPRILRAIVDGRLPRRIGVRHLAALPASWAEQERALGLGEQDKQGSIGREQADLLPAAGALSDCGSPREPFGFAPDPLQRRTAKPERLSAGPLHAGTEPDD
jgi:hypothetical protein